MKQNIIYTGILMMGISLLIFVYSCKKDKVPVPATDEILFNMAQSMNGFTWYKKSDTLFARSSGSGHSQPFLRTRFNSTASAKLDSDGKVIPGSIFPEGSLIVKELFADETTLGRYAILYKNPSHQDADSKGWVWGYINADGSVAVPAAEKGASCSGCHSQSENIDYMLMNKSFP